MTDNCNLEDHVYARQCLETLWQVYRRRRIHPEAEENQLRCTRDAFFAGGQSIVILLLALRDLASKEPDDEELRQGAAQIHAIVAELEKLMAEGRPSSKKE